MVAYKESGFTLIELVMVIVILGILAATALPKFIDLGADARRASIESVSGSIRAFDQLVFAQAVILGIENNDRNSSSSSTDPQGGFVLENQFIRTIYGHPWLFDVDALTYVLDIDVKNEGSNNNINGVCDYDGDFCSKMVGRNNFGISFRPGNSIIVYPPNYSISQNCFAYYIFDRTNNGVKIGSVTTGC